MAELPGRAVRPPAQLPAEDHPGADAGADEDDQQVVEGAAAAEPELGKGADVDVVVDHHVVELQLAGDHAAQRHRIVEAGQVGRAVDGARLALDPAGAADADAGEPLHVDLGVLGGRPDRVGDRLDHRAGPTLGRRLGAADARRREV